MACSNVYETVIRPIAILILLLGDASLDAYSLVALPKRLSVVVVQVGHSLPCRTVSRYDGHPHGMCFNLNIDLIDLISLHNVIRQRKYEFLIIHLITLWQTARDRADEHQLW